MKTSSSPESKKITSSPQHKQGDLGNYGHLLCLFKHTCSVIKWLDSEIVWSIKVLMSNSVEVLLLEIPQFLRWKGSNSH